MPRGIFPLIDQPQLDSLFTRLGDALRRHDFQTTSVLPWPGRPFHILREHENIGRYISGGNNAYESSALSAVYRMAYGRRHPEAVELYEMFHLEKPHPLSEFERLLGSDLANELVTREVLIPAEGSPGLLISRARASAFEPLIQISDTESMFQHEKESAVFCGRCSSRLVSAVRKEFSSGKRIKRGLDLCTGSGIQALNFAAYTDEVWGSDLNPRAVSFSTANAKLNGIDHARFVVSDLFTNLEGRFDLITANTPFLLLDQGSTALPGYGGEYGMEVELRLIEGLEEHLEPGGVSMLVVSSAFVAGENLLATRLEKIFKKGGYEIDLFPISQYYSKDHWRAYESVHVEKCVLYIMRTEKVGGTQLTLRAHDWSRGVREVLDVKVRLEREIARRRHIKRFGTDSVSL